MGICKIFEESYIYTTQDFLPGTIIKIRMHPSVYRYY